MEETIKSIQAVLDGNLVVGDHDSITLLGAAAQNDLNEASRMMAATIQNPCPNLSDEPKIENMVRMISELDRSVRNFHPKHWMHHKQSEKTKREFNTALETIAALNSSLKLKQVTLLREAKIMEHIQSSLEDCEQKLNACIFSGKTVLQNRLSTKEPVHIFEVSDAFDSDRSFWYSRLESRISNLQMSRSVALRCQLQAALLYHNDLILSDQIRYLISNVIPMWRNQVTLMIKVWSEPHITEVCQNIREVDEPLREELLKVHELTERLNGQRMKLNCLLNKQGSE